MPFLKRHNKTSPMLLAGPKQQGKVGQHRLVDTYWFLDISCGHLSMGFCWFWRSWHMSRLLNPRQGYRVREPSGSLLHCPRAAGDTQSWGDCPTGSSDSDCLSKSVYTRWNKFVQLKKGLLEHTKGLVVVSLVTPAGLRVVTLHVLLHLPCSH